MDFFSYRMFFSSFVLDLEDGEKMTISEYEILKARVLARGWKFNNFTAYLLETNRNPSIVAYCLGISRSTAYYWLTQKELSGVVNFFFLIARKLRTERNIDILDLV